MPQYLSPGVYVEEVPSGSAPIAGVGTSTAGFIGLVADDVQMPLLPGKENECYTVADACYPYPIRIFRFVDNSWLCSESQKKQQ